MDTGTMTAGRGATPLVNAVGPASYTRMETALHTRPVTYRPTKCRRNDVYTRSSYGRPM